MIDLTASLEIYISTVQRRDRSSTSRKPKHLDVKYNGSKGATRRCNLGLDFSLGLYTGVVEGFAGNTKKHENQIERVCTTVVCRYRTANASTAQYICIP